jgi:hypothetical protein
MQFRNNKTDDALLAQLLLGIRATASPRCYHAFKALSCRPRLGKDPSYPLPRRRPSARLALPIAQRRESTSSRVSLRHGASEGRSATHRRPGLLADQPGNATAAGTPAHTLCLSTPAAPRRPAPPAATSPRPPRGSG